MRVLVVALVVCAGCTAEVVPLEDAGTTSDAGMVAVDAGPSTDAGTALDAGAPTDAGTDFDGGLVAITFAPSDAPTPNPERGFYIWASDDFGASIDTGAIDDGFAKGYRLAYAVVNLAAFRTTPISPAFLTALSGRFATLRAHGMKAVLRFVYDYTAGGNDATAAQIASHLTQLAPVLAENADTIAIFQAGFIGAWGEWHSSKHSNSYGYMTNAGVTQAQADANRLIVRDALFANVPAGIPIVFRYPRDLITWFAVAEQQARAGLHNDCFLAGPSDTGTYNSQAERTYVATLSARASFGGETCDADTPLRTSCSGIRTEGARYHLGYLNHEFYEGFITAWTSGGCIDEVTRQMGYRLQLDAVAHPARARAGEKVIIAVDMRNVGWARASSDRYLVATLSDGTQTFTAAASVSLTTLDAQATGSTRVTVETNLPAGTWTVSLAAPDVSERLAADQRFAVRFANSGDQSSGRLITGTSITIE